MVDRMPYHKRYHDDALIGYRSLTLEQRGAYTTILDMLYSEGGFINDDERRIAAEMRISTRLWRSIRDQLVKAGKLYYPSPGKLSNRRFEDVMADYIKKSVQAKLNGRNGGRKSRELKQFSNNINEPPIPNSKLIQKPEYNLLPFRSREKGLGEK